MKLLFLLFMFVNADFDDSIPTQLLTSKGRKQIVEAYENLGRNTAKTWNDTGGAVWNGVSTALDYKRIAQTNYDNAKEIYELTGMYPSNYNLHAHEEAAYAWGKTVGNPAVAFLLRGISESVVQPVQYGTIYNQQNFSTSLYDPFDRYDPSLGGYAPDKYGTEGSMSGTGYWKDGWQDTLNVFYGAQGKTFIPPNENSK